MDNNQPYVSATELANLGKCEKQVQLRHTLGERYTESQLHMMREGNAVHERYYKQLSRDRRCFIATAMYGQDAWQTCLLRHFRDHYLMPHAVGRFCVKAYYRMSPPLATYLATHKKRLVYRIAQIVLGVTVRIVKWLM